MHILNLVQDTGVFKNRYFPPATSLLQQFHPIYPPHHYTVSNGNRTVREICGLLYIYIYIINTHYYIGTVFTVQHRTIRRIRTTYSLDHFSYWTVNANQLRVGWCRFFSSFNFFSKFVPLVVFNLTK